MKRSVPVEYEGLWRRSIIRRSNGSSDSTTQVWWFQSSSFHIDLRIPVDRPVVASAAELEQLTPAQRQRYAAQIGFAGTTVVDGTRCTWHPEIAFPLVSSEVDAGSMRFDSADQLHEAGLDGSYDEDWFRVPTGAMHGVRLQDPDSAAIAYLLISASSMAWACGRPDDAYTADASPPQASPPQPCSEFSIFHKTGDWTIVASNLPWREQRITCDASALTLATVQQWQDGECVTVPYSSQRWHVDGIAAIAP